MIGRACQSVSVLFCAMVLLAASAAAQAGDKGNLNITIKQIKNANGQLLICLFSKPDNFPTCKGDGAGARAFGTRAKKGAVSVVLKQLPVGTYAISVAHDQNDDGKIERHLLFGYPTEGAGMSNYPKPPFGKPHFETARFQLSKGTGTVEIIMHYP